MGVEKTVTGPMENVSFEQSAANEIVVNDGVIRFLFVIDNANRILSKYEYFNNSVIKYQYTYDDDGRLSNVRMNDELVEEYFYDGKGRRVSDYNYFRAQNKRDYKYDSRGQLKKAGDIIFKYDNAGRLLLRQDRKKKMKFSYNGYGLIATAKISSEGKALEPIKYSYDRNGRRVGVSCGDDLITSYEWDGNRIKNMVDGSWWSFDYENDSVLPISFEKNGEKYFPSYDNVGTLRAVVDQRGELVWSVLYDSFGNVIYEKDQDFGVPFGFAGGVRDEYTGFCHFLLREYDSEIARWNRIDPLGYAAGDIDLYGYCLDDPINLRDVAGAKVCTEIVST